MTAPYFAYGAVNLIGESNSALKNISESVVKHNDIAVALDENKIYFFKMDEHSGLDENVPYVIKPFDSSSDKRWVLISQEIYNSNIIQLLGNYIQTSEIRAISEQSLEIIAAGGSKILINSDGTVVFPSIVSGLNPIDDYDFTTKLYVDNNIDILNNNLLTYYDDEILSLGTSLSGDIDNEFTEKQTILNNYIDNELNIFIENANEQLDTFTESLSGYIVNEINDINNLLDSETVALSGYIDDKVIYLNQSTIDKENELKTYHDQYIEDELYNVYVLYRKNITSWSYSDGIFYNDVVHNKSRKHIIIRCWNYDELIYPTKIEYIDDNTTRIWMESEENITVVVI